MFSDHTARPGSCYLPVVGAKHSSIWASPQGQRWFCGGPLRQQETVVGVHRARRRCGPVVSKGLLPSRRDGQVEPLPLPPPHSGHTRAPWHSGLVLGRHCLRAMNLGFLCLEPLPRHLYHAFPPIRALCRLQFLSRAPLTPP